MTTGQRQELALREFAPKSMLRVPAHTIDRPRFPVIDAHNHLGPTFGGVWHTRTVSELREAMDQCGVELLVDLDGGQGDGLSAHIAQWQAHGRQRVVVFAGLDYARWSSDPTFGETEARSLRNSIERGARGLKVWKPLGLTARDPGGRVVPVDDPRLDPLWATAGELGVPILIHVGDPFAFFEPLDATNERWEELEAHPDWHFWPARATADGDGPGYPHAIDILEQLGRMIGRHPGTTFVAAHVASASEDLALVGQLLDANPNLYVDIAERIGELGRQPYSARAFFIRFADRILFGVDQPVDPVLYRIHYRFLETFDESFDYGIGRVPRQGRWQIHGIGLPDDVLQRVYRDNARVAMGL